MKERTISVIDYLVKNFFELKFSFSFSIVVPIDDALDLLSIIKYGYLTVLKNGSHMVLIEQVEIVNKLIHLFLNDSFI